MIELIKIEMKKLLKSRKNKILLLVLILFLISINIYYREKQRNYIKELEEELTIDYNSAQIRLNKVSSILFWFESEDESYKELLKRKYGSLEKSEENRVILQTEQDRNKRELSYANVLLQLQKQLMSSNRRTSINEDEVLKEILDYRIRRTNNIIEADKEGVVPETALKLRKITMDDIRIKSLYYNYLADNNIKYNINPYTNTGIFSVSKLLDNYSIFFIFVIFTLMSIDLFLSEVEEGSYKIAYTQPYGRQEIFFSRVIAMTLFLIILLSLMLIINLVVNTILNSLGDFSEPVVVSENIGRITLNKENIEFKIIPIGKNILLSAGLFLAVIFFNIGLISILSTFTDSASQTIGIEVSLVMLSLLFRKFVLPSSIIHGLSPFNYIFTQDVLIQRYNSSLILGVLLNLGLGIILLIISSRGFIKKDFLGSKI